MRAMPAFMVLLLSVAVTPDVLDQVAGGEISGVVVDAIRQPVADQRVELRRPSSQGPGRLVTTTDMNGQFAHASPSPNGHPTTADSPVLLSRAIERETRRLVQSEAEGMWRAPNLGSTRTRLRRCTSKKKGVLIGAAVGAVATVVWAFRSPNPAAWGAAGAGVGAFIGLGYCTSP